MSGSGKGAKVNRCKDTIVSAKHVHDINVKTRTDTGTGAKVNQCKDTIVSAKHDHDINVKTWTDVGTCVVSGLALLSDGRLVLADCNYNQKIKTVNIQSGHVLSELRMPCAPWDVTAISNNKVAVTLPREKKLIFISVGDDNLSIDRTLTVSGTCYGIDYRNDQLAVSYTSPPKVQVLNLQGTVLYIISAYDEHGTALFNFPYYLSYGQDGTTLYVSNISYNSEDNTVMCVKLDGTVATYTDSDLKYPRKPGVDSHGNVYVCAQETDQDHQISKDCKKIQVLLTQADGLREPYSICLSEENDKLYIEMTENDTIKVYTIERRTQ